MSWVGRLFGRRDVKVFLLLWAPVAWTWLLSSAVDQTSWYFAADHLLLAFLATLLGPGLVILGTASGVDRHCSLKQRRGIFRVRGEFLCLTLSALMGVTLILGGAAVTLFAYWGSIASMHDLCHSLYLPGGVLLAEYSFPLYGWKASIWFAGPWVGWVAGYRLGRRWGRFLPALLATGILSVGYGWFFCRLTRLHFGGSYVTERLDWMRQYTGIEWEGVRELYSGALFVDVSLAITVLLALGFLTGLWLEKRTPRWTQWLRRVALVLLIAAFFFGYRRVVLNQIDPWPPPAFSVEGLDPINGQMWATFGPDTRNLSIYALKHTGAQPATDGTAPQILYFLDSVEYGREFLSYDLSTPAMLARNWREKSLSCRTSAGTDRIELDRWQGPFSWLPIRVRGPKWFACADSRYWTAMVRDATGNPYREFRSRMFLYCPRSGERLTVALHQRGYLHNIRDELKGSGYQLWPETTLSDLPAPPDGVRITASRPEDADRLRTLLADGFLVSDQSAAGAGPVLGFKNLTGEGLESEVWLEMFEPWSDRTRQKIPSPSGQLGCVWSWGKGNLELYEAGNLLEPVIRDATAAVAPSWSPDGRFLAYASHTWGATQCALKLAYPERREILRTRTRAEPRVLWSPDSNHIAVIKDRDSEHSTLTVLRTSDFSPVLEWPHSGYTGDIGFLHDGCLPFIENGRIYVWRPGWEKPVCIYDPGKETVLGSKK